MKHSPPTTGRSTGSAAAISRSIVSGANPMSVSIQNSQSAVCSFRNAATSLFRESTSPSVPHVHALYPPRMIRAEWARSHPIISIMQWWNEAAMFFSCT